MGRVEGGDILVEQKIILVVTELITKLCQPLCNEEKIGEPFFSRYLFVFVAFFYKPCHLEFFQRGFVFSLHYNIGTCLNCLPTLKLSQLLTVGRHLAGFKVGRNFIIFIGTILELLDACAPVKL